MLGQLAHREIIVAIVVVIATAVAIGIMTLVVKTKKPAELPESMRKKERYGHSDG
jgi:hypothetical protein